MSQYMAAKYMRDSRKRSKELQTDHLPKTAKTSTERSRIYRARLEIAGEHTPSPTGWDSGEASSLQEIPSFLPTHEEPNFERATQEFRKRFLENDFGHPCDVCDRIWFKNDLKPVSNADATLLLATNGFGSVEGFSACQTCRSSLKRGSIPNLSKSNGFTYPNYPSNLPPLDPLTTRLISPRINFMQLRRLRRAAGL